MGAQGQIVINFGAGSDRATVNVTGQAGILASSLCEAWIDATAPATAEHTQDEHEMAAAGIGISCTAIVAGTGFTIVAASAVGIVAGHFNLAWVWN